MRAAHHREQALRLVPLGNARGEVHVVAVPSVEPHRKNLSAARYADLVRRRVDHLVYHAVADALPQVVALRRLVEDNGDHAVELGAELLVRCAVGEAAGPDRADVGRRVVRQRTGHSVERPGVLRVEGAHRAVGGHARVAGRGEDVAGPLGRRGLQLVVGLERRGHRVVLEHALGGGLHRDGAFPLAAVHLHLRLGPVPLEDAGVFRGLSAEAGRRPVVRRELLKDQQRGLLQGTYTAAAGVLAYYIPFLCASAGSARQGCRLQGRRQSRHRRSRAMPTPATRTGRAA